MLVLQRKIGQEICVGDGIIIKVLAIKGRAIRLGIEAPLSVPIRRGEFLPTTPGQQHHSLEEAVVSVAASPCGR
jgi:carbon storage regulator